MTITSPRKGPALSSFAILAVFLNTVSANTDHCFSVSDQTSNSNSIDFFVLKAKHAAVWIEPALTKCANLGVNVVTCTADILGKLTQNLKEMCDDGLGKQSPTVTLFGAADSKAAGLECATNRISECNNGDSGLGVTGVQALLVLFVGVPLLICTVITIFDAFNACRKRRSRPNIDGGDAPLLNQQATQTSFRQFKPKQPENTSQAVPSIVIRCQVN